jgi:hypothetical protein
MHRFSVTGTVIAQLITMVICIAAGAALVALFFLGVETLDIRFADGSHYSFLLGIGFCGIVLLILTIGTTVYQFDNALTSVETFQLSVSYSLRALIVVAITCLLLNLLVLVTVGHSLTSFLVEVIGTVVMIPVLGVVIGAVQAISLFVRRFDPKMHMLMIGDEGDIDACRRGLLPYRQQVYLVLQILGFVLIISVFAVGTWIAWIEAEMIMTLIVGGGIIIAGLARVIDKFNLLVNPQIISVQGEIHKSVKKEYAKSVGRVT